MGKPNITIPGQLSDRFKTVIFVYQVINSGMVSFIDVKNGTVSLVELLEMSWFLEMKNDIEYVAMKNAEKRGK